MDRPGRRIRRTAGWVFVVLLGASLTTGSASARRHTSASHKSSSHSRSRKGSGRVLVRHSRARHHLVTSQATLTRHGRRRHQLRSHELAFQGFDATGQPRLRSRAAIVYDLDGDRVLYSKNLDATQPIASLTKIMTALVLLDTGPSWDSVVTMTRSDIYAASHTHLRSGERIMKRDLFQLSLMVSDNAATRALVRSSGLPHDQFVGLMNTKARSLGLSGTHFVEETGLEPANVSTARDYARLLSAASKSPMIASITSSPHYEFRTSRGPRTIANTDRLLYGNYDVMAGKTGFINEAGYCFATCVRIAGHPMVSVVLGAPTKGTRFLETMKLIDWAVQRQGSVAVHPAAASPLPPLGMAR